MAFDESGRAELFLRLYTQDQHRLAAFVHTLVPNWTDGEELLQEVALVLWKKFDDFDPGTVFFRWAARVAQYEVLNYRRKQQRSAVKLDNEAVDRLAITMVEQPLELEVRREALKRCVERLGARDRQILSLRYQEGGNAQSVAEAIDRTPSLVHKSLQRIRAILMRCVEANLSQAAR